MPGLTLTRMPVDGDADVALLEAVGVIDPNTASVLIEAFHALDAEGERRIVIDCTEVGYMNCTGLGTLVKYAEALLERGGGIALLGVNQKNRTVLEMLRLEHSFVTVCEHRPGAFAALADPARFAKAREQLKLAKAAPPPTTGACCRSDPSSKQEPD